MKRATDKLIALQFLAVVLPIAVVLLVQMAADARRAAHREALDGVDDIVNGARAFVACLMRKQTLVEINDRVAVPGNDGQTPAGTCAV